MLKSSGASKKKAKSKKQLHAVKKGLLPLSLQRFFFAVGRFLNNIVLFIRRYKKWILFILTILVVTGLWFLSQTWLVRTTFSQVISYPSISVLGKNVGNLDANHLDEQLASLKSEFESRKITLVNDKSKWTFEIKKLGVTFDTKTTSDAILKLNKLSFAEKYQLLTGAKSSTISPSISVDNDICVKSLSVIPAVQINPTDATIYFDQVLKIKPDQPGTKFDAVLTCRELPKKLATNSAVINVSLDVAQANFTKSGLESKLSYAQAAIGKSLTIKNSSGSYQTTLTPEQLWGLFEVTKNGSDTQVDWSQSKLDDLVNDIASKVNTYDAIPAIGGCQYLVSGGGSWLDKASTKKIFTDLNADNSRNYTLPISHHDSVVSDIKPINQGTKGTIYLTYDDGLTYGDRIMNLAACYGIKVTFFELGSRVGTDAVALRRAIAEGHAVQSHGYEHAAYDYGSRSYDWQVNDMAQSITAITNVTGIRPTYFRPPGGNKSSLTYDAAAVNGLNLIMWGDASRDSAPSGVTSSLTCANVLAGAYPGASVLMHSTKQSTAEALPCIAEGLAARGYNMQALR